MSDNKTQRLTIRFTDEDLQWLDQQAADEGVEPATLVRMIVHRLRNGRPPLVGQMLDGPRTTPVRIQRTVASHMPPLLVGGEEEYGEGEIFAPELANDILESRLAEAGMAETAAPAESPVGNGAAVSLRRVPREKYNPGRR